MFSDGSKRTAFVAVYFNHRLICVWRRTTGVGYCMGSMSIAGLRYDLAGQYMATESTDLTQFMVVWDIEINPEWPNNSGLGIIGRPDVFMLYMYTLCRSMYTSTSAASYLIFWEMGVVVYRGACDLTFLWYCIHFISKNYEVDLVYEGPS